MRTFLLLLMCCITVPAMAGTGSLVCDLAKQLYSPMWSGTMLLSGTFAFMMAFMDRFALSEMTLETSSVSRLKFRYSTWLPLIKISLCVLAVSIIDQIIISKTVPEITVAVLFLMFTAYLTWTTRCKLLLNPLNNNDDKIDVAKFLKAHISFYLIFYGTIALVLYGIEVMSATSGCIR